MLINEQDLLHIISSSQNIILLEPPYKSDYMPLGLAKISAFAKGHGCNTVYQRKYSPLQEDLVCVTTCFTYDADIVFKELDSIYFFNPNANVVIGGIFASLMPTLILKKYPNIKLFSGCSPILDSVIPDYSIDYQIKEVWNDYSTVFTTRGCKNACAYCCVSKLEPNHYISPNWKDHIIPLKKYVMISDNNLSSQPIEHIADVVNYVNLHKKKVYLNNGLDCKYITPENAKLFGSMKYVNSGFRIGFDRITEDGIFQEAIKLLVANGVPRSMITVFSLFNFLDTPREAVYRNNECVKLGIRPYPNMFKPLNLLSKKEKYLGKYWTPKLRDGFRNFFLMAGNYKKQSFEKFMNDRNLSVFTEEQIVNNPNIIPTPKDSIFRGDLFGKVRFTQDDVSKYYETDIYTSLKDKHN